MSHGGPNFWTDSLVDHPDRNDPKRAYRFIVKLLSYEAAATWYAKSVTKPSITVTDTSHTYLNHKFYYPGRVEWGEISVTLVDPVSPDAAAETFAIIESAGYHIPTNSNSPSGTDSGGLTTMSKARAVAALGGVKIEQIDSEGLPLETWDLVNPFIKSVNLGDLSYENDALTTITLGLRYDYATCATRNKAQQTGDEKFKRPSGNDANKFFFRANSAPKGS